MTAKNTPIPTGSYYVGEDDQHAAAGTWYTFDVDGLAVAVHEDNVEQFKRTGDLSLASF